MPPIAARLLRLSEMENAYHVSQSFQVIAVLVFSFKSLSSFHSFSVSLPRSLEVIVSVNHIDEYLWLRHHMEKYPILFIHKTVNIQS